MHIHVTRVSLGRTLVTLTRCGASVTLDVHDGAGYADTFAFWCIGDAMFGIVAAQC